MSAREARRRKSKMKRQQDKDEIRHYVEIFSDVMMNGRTMRKTPNHSNLPLTFWAYYESLEKRH
ncbi:MAG: hypothetical protein JSW61_04000 [Candidatus Thorarchaeota archaeon]|nr:MAG: hypothetical protein JSW61_04000 [Candidatus Thorarchaeota archaeon]